MRSAAQPAFVLHQWDWSETSLILDLFTREQGRLAAVAKGAKRPYSQLRAVLLPFQRIAVTLGRPKADESSDILTLRAAEYAAGGAVLPPPRLFAGFYLNELLMKLLARQDPHALLFDAYADTLHALAGGDEEAPLRAFELLLLRETGVLPELGRDTVTQQALEPGRSYALRPESGLVASADAALSGRDWQALQVALDVDDPAALRATDPATLSALKPQLRTLLHYHLGSPQLRTRAAMLDVRRLLDKD
ncbi:DNA repair protein RecO [Aquincola sp. S2]|uniref:DNA repair protein RecO n=1 Tax=Pseudaquabacterium terrae TaxID=2732868 RepID=A0ABX2EE12_9BURK|nr:DNA repair protein RecO [Aquabacterium terrae]NRF66848.1 DNA repair protein RecO [Aquabacterium terrae]